MLAKIIEMLAENKNVPVSAIDANTNLESLGIDSLDITDMIFDLEGKLHIRLPDDVPASEYARLETVGDLEQLIVTHAKNLNE